MPAWLPAVVFGHALAKNGTICSPAMATEKGPAGPVGSTAKPFRQSALLRRHLLAAASRVAILLCDSVHVLRRRFRLSRIQGEVDPPGLRLNTHIG